MWRAQSAFSRRISPDPYRAAALLALLASGCAATVPVDEHPGQISPAALLRAAPLTGAEDPAPVADVDMLGLDEDMHAFIEEHVNRRLPQERRFMRLIDAVMGESGRRVEYDDRTYTAAQAYHRREANCLSFTNLFVAMARSIDLDVSFQEVDVPPDWSRSGDTMVLNRHINALVTTRKGRQHVVDFNMSDFRASYPRRKISDVRAFAHYYSNLGAERLQARQDVEALRYFRKAIAQDPAFTAAWVNLGTLYLRGGRGDEARAAWRYALALDPGEQVAMSNLERLYRDGGDIRMADEFRSRIQRHRMQNPYYRFFLAQQAFDARDYDAAIDHLKFAVKQKQDEDRFFALLGLSYLRRGDAELARHWIARAEAVAGDEQLRSGYHSKLEMLRRDGAG